MCLYPTIIKNPKYKATKKNGGVIPPLNDERVKYVPIGCQQCIECRKQKARGWQVRLLEDLKYHKNGKFITLTFSDESIKKLKEHIDGKLSVDEDGVLLDSPLEGYELDNEIATLGVRLFLERWRKKYKKSLRHWLVTEIGHNGTQNIHLHGIVWTDDVKEVERIWNYGFVWKGEDNRGRIINYVSEITVNYIVKYIHKVDVKHKEYRSLVLTSPGIGAGYMDNIEHKKNKYKGVDTDTTYRTRQGFKIALPIYWRNKIYSEAEREKLWLIMLDKQERWVCGERVDISQGDKEYFELLEYYREKNIRLGYGTGERDWKRYEYEKQQRLLKQKERISRAEYRMSCRTGVLAQDIGMN